MRARIYVMILIAALFAMTFAGAALAGQSQQVAAPTPVPVILPEGWTLSQVMTQNSCREEWLFDTMRRSGIVTALELYRLKPGTLINLSPGCEGPAPEEVKKATAKILEDEKFIASDFAAKKELLALRAEVAGMQKKAAEAAAAHANEPPAPPKENAENQGQGAEVERLQKLLAASNQDNYHLVWGRSGILLFFVGSLIVVMFWVLLYRGNKRLAIDTEEKASRSRATEATLKTLAGHVNDLNNSLLTAKRTARAANERVVELEGQLNGLPGTEAKLATAENTARALKERVVELEARENMLRDQTALVLSLPEGTTDPKILVVEMEVTRKNKDAVEWPFRVGSIETDYTKSEVESFARLTCPCCYENNIKIPLIKGGKKVAEKDRYYNADAHMRRCPQNRRKQSATTEDINAPISVAS